MPGHEARPIRHGCAAEGVRLSGMSWRFVPASAMADVAGDWNGFVDSTGSPGFLRTEFIAPALNFFGKGRETVALGMSGRTVGSRGRTRTIRARTVGHVPTRPTATWCLGDAS